MLQITCTERYKFPTTHEADRCLTLLQLPLSHIRPRIGNLLIRVLAQSRVEAGEQEHSFPPNSLPRGKVRFPILERPRNALNYHVAGGLAV